MTGVDARIYDEHVTGPSVASIAANAFATVPAGRADIALLDNEGPPAAFGGSGQARRPDAPVSWNARTVAAPMRPPVTATTLPLNHSSCKT